MAAALATSPSSGGGGAAATPRKLLKLLRGACHTLERHAGQLEPEVARALKACAGGEWQGLHACGVRHVSVQCVLCAAAVAAAAACAD